MIGRRVATPEVPGLWFGPAFVADDDRGRFVKLHSAGDPRFGTDVRDGADEHWAEVYHSTSRRGVVRGMHLQLAPDAHVKAVHCLAGAAVDVVVDLRPDSPTAGAHTAVDLDAASPSIVVVPEGCAHGFQALVDGTVMLYLVSSVHSPSNDSGVRYDSFGFAWPLAPLAVSDRDAGLTTAEEFLASRREGRRP